MITPYVFDKGTGKLAVNHDFVELYPEQSASTFTPDELKQAGHGRLLEEVQKAAHDQDNVHFSGDEQERIKEITK